MKRFVVSLIIIAISFYLIYLFKIYSVENEEIWGREVNFSENQNYSIPKNLDQLPFKLIPVFAEDLKKSIFNYSIKDEIPLRYFENEYSLINTKIIRLETINNRYSYFILNNTNQIDKEKHGAYLFNTDGELICIIEFDREAFLSISPDEKYICILLLPITDKFPEAGKSTITVFTFPGFNFIRGDLDCTPVSDINILWADDKFYFVSWNMLKELDLLNKTTRAIYAVGKLSDIYLQGIKKNKLIMRIEYNENLHGFGTTKEIKSKTVKIKI